MRRSWRGGQSCASGWTSTGWTNWSTAGSPATPWSGSRTTAARTISTRATGCALRSAGPRTTPARSNDLDLRFLHAGRTKRLRTVAAWAGAALAVLLLIGVAGLAYTGTLNRLLYRPPSPQWLAVPGGEFLMGSTPDEVAAADVMDAADLAEEPDVLGYDFSGEQPAHWVELSPYQIMRYEVTRAEYHQCQRAGVCDASIPPLSVTGVRRRAACYRRFARESSRLLPVYRRQPAHRGAVGIRRPWAPAHSSGSTPGATSRTRAVPT